MPRRSWICAALVVLPLAGCTTSSAPSPPPVTSAPARPALRLVSFDSCAQLTKELRAAAQQSLTTGSLGDGTMLRGMPDQARAANAQAAKATVPHSQTNVHEAGVDEPDIVKTDGRRIVTVSGGVLRVVDPTDRRQTGKLDLALQSFGEARLLLAGDRALVLVSGTGRGHPLYDAKVIGGDDGRSEVLLVDLAGTGPRLLGRYRGDGSLVDARQTGSTARVVLSSTPKFTFPLRGGTPGELLDDGRQAVAQAPIEAWLPSWEITTGGTRTTGRLDCAAVSRPETFSGTSMLRVLTFDLAAPTLGDGDPVGVVADGDAVYGTATSLYIANNQGWRLNAVGESVGAVPSTPETDIYRFSLPATGRPAYVAAGKVPGTLINQYAMSEWDGHLRVATTDPKARSSAVRVLREDNGKLAEVGRVDGLGRNEQIYSVRFLGPRGYVVTFRKTDPLYSLDLADPQRPRVTGELKITGYSAHLQPVGDDRLIGIGQEADTDGRASGTQVSLFDVADPAAPRRLSRHLVPGGWSEAEADPHAVLWWPATGLLVLPVSDERSDAALALRVTGNQVRAVSRLAAPAGDAGPMRRALVIGDVLWTVSDRGLLASDVSTLDRLGWVATR